MLILIIGAAGFIGSSFCHWLLENTEHKVVGVDNLSTGHKDNLPKHERFIFTFCDITRITHLSNLNRIFERESPNVCFHFAAYAAEGRSNYIRGFIHHNNTFGTANVINCCVNHNCKLIFTSSVAVYSGKPPFTEETIPNPIDEYGLSKWMSEKSIQIAGEQQGLDWCIIRPRNVYGERQALTDPSRNVMGIWMRQIMTNEPMTIYGDGQQTRNFTYIGDILEPLYNAKDISKQIINLGSDHIYKVIVAANILSFCAGYNEMLFLEPRHEVKEAYCSSEKSKQLLGYEDKTSLAIGILKMWRWAIEQPKRELQIPPKLEIEKGVHSSVK